MKLLPCPFCGHTEPSIVRYGDSKKSTQYECGMCSCFLETSEEFNHGTQWNQRSQSLSGNNNMNNVAYLLRECLGHLERAQIKVDLVLSETVNTPDNFPCIGYFDDKERSLQVALQDTNWLFTFVHEYCHFLQNVDGLWIDDYSVNASSKFEQWLKHEIELADLEVLKLTRNIQDCELDCERRTISLLKAYHIEFNEQEYIKLANRYVLSYEVARLYRNDVKFSDNADKLIPDKLITDVYHLPADLLSFVELKGL